MARSENNLKAVLQDTADAIRAKDGSSAKICPRDFADKVRAIPAGPEPTGEIEISVPFTKVNVADKEFAYTNNDCGIFEPTYEGSSGDFCDSLIVGNNDTSYEEPLYVERGCPIYREYDSTREISEYNDPYLFTVSKRCSYYVYSDGTIKSKFPIDQVYINQNKGTNRLALVLDCVYNPSLIPSGKEIRFNFGNTINIHHPNCSFEEAISKFGDYIDIVDLRGRYIKKNIPINDVVTEWKDNDSSSSSSSNSNDYNY